MSSTAIAQAAGRKVEPLRLTRRGRFVALLTFVILATALVVAGGRAIGSDEGGEPLPVKVVHVQPGDTLWSIASETTPGEDPRELIARIQDLNGLSGSLQVGERIAVPLD